MKDEGLKDNDEFAQRKSNTCLPSFILHPSSLIP
jgi:hypothetical protein